MDSSCTWAAVVDPLPAEVAATILSVAAAVYPPPAEAEQDAAPPLAVVETVLRCNSGNRFCLKNYDGKKGCDSELWLMKKSIYGKRQL